MTRIIDIIEQAENGDSKSISKIRDKGKVRLHGINTAVKKLTQAKE